MAALFYRQTRMAQRWRYVCRRSQRSLAGSGKRPVVRNVKARAITRISFREMAMQRYWFVVLSCVLLLAAVGFALDLGVLAMMLRS